MSLVGVPQLDVDGTGRRIAVIASCWYGETMEALTERAIERLEQAGAEVSVIRVPGTFELPVACARLAPHFDGLVALGVVVRGATPHFEYVCQGATHGITQVATSTGVPIGFGVLTCETVEQAMDRSGAPGSHESKGTEAAEAVLAMLNVLEPYPMEKD